MELSQPVRAILSFPGLADTVHSRDICGSVRVRYTVVGLFRFSRYGLDEC